MGDTNGGDYFAVNVGDMKQREPAEPGPVSTLRVDATGSEEAVSRAISMLYEIGKALTHGQAGNSKYTGQQL